MVKPNCVAHTRPCSSGTETTLLSSCAACCIASTTLTVSPMLPFGPYELSALLSQRTQKWFSGDCSTSPVFRSTLSYTWDESLAASSALTPKLERT